VCVCVGGKRCVCVYVYVWVRARACVYRRLRLNVMLNYYVLGVRDVITKVNRDKLIRNLLCYIIQK